MSRLSYNNQVSVIGTNEKTPEPPARPLGSYISEMENQTEAMLNVAITIHSRMFGDGVQLMPNTDEPNSCIDNRLSRLVDINANLFRILVSMEERL